MVTAEIRDPLSATGVKMGLSFGAENA